MAAGIRTRHGRSCRSRDGGRCNCNTGRMRRGSTRSGTTRRSARRSSRWPRRRAGALTLRVGPRAHSPGAVQGHAHRRGRRRLKGAKAGTIRTRSGDAYKPSAIRSYEAALRLRVLPELGGARVSDVSRVDLQEFIEGIKAKGLNASTVQTTLMPVRAIYRRAIAKGQVAVNPTTALEVPAIRGKRDRIASPAEAARLLAALPERDRALWAAAMYAGLRRGELMALRWEGTDLAAGVLRVERSWDAKAGAVEPKTEKGRRTVPIASPLGDHLVEQRIRTADPEGLVFGDGSRPFEPSPVRMRAAKAWCEAGLERITLHECRHTFASLMIAAGVNAKTLSTYMGHANISITLDRYGHLMPGSEAEAAGLLDTYLAAELDRSAEQARAAT